mgnify:CR=1 FL=1|jgi:hypothetical protein|tara:strand:+ start:484 stop:636 length:153 start_codon:yes stop_codon:yes gene_type:complete
MLFRFGKFWKTMLFIVSSWLFYGIWGFEFATITLLALICARNFKDSTKIL